MKRLRLSLYVKVDKVNVVGEVPVFVKISYKGTKTALSLDVRVDDSRWKDTNQLHNTRVMKEVKLRNDIDDMLATLRALYDKLIQREEPFSAGTIKEFYLNNGEDPVTNKLMLSELFDKHYKSFVPLVNSETRAKDTLRKYQTLRNHVYEFIAFEFKLEDVPLKSLNYAFIESFDIYLRSEKGIGNNTTVKYVQSFRRLMNIAVKYDWLLKDPFILYEKKVKVKDAEYLTQGELEKLEELTFTTERLEVVRDLFVFGCYTGYSPVDLHKLTNKNIVKGKDGQKWVITKRTKTGINADVPLLPQAEKLIDKYSSDPYCLETGHILPKRSTQKMNMYLKEVAEIAEISKNLHQYVARHTFSCTIILANGLSMGVLSKMLGHNSLRQTQHYGKIQNARVSEEMKVLKNKFLK
jgi:site-specific recombinase XerD